MKDSTIFTKDSSFRAFYNFKLFFFSDKQKNLITLVISAVQRKDDAVVNIG